VREHQGAAPGERFVGGFLGGEQPPEELIWIVGGSQALAFGLGQDARDEARTQVCAGRDGIVAVDDVVADDD